MKKIRSKIGLLICCCILLISSVSVFAADKDFEPKANLEVITNRKDIDKIVNENPRLQQYLDQNETFADLEIITDETIIKEICDENPNVKKLMESREYYYLAYVKGNGVRLRNTPSTSGVVNGLLYESRGDWVLLNDNYSLNQNYLWWQVADSSIGYPGWVVNDYIYLSMKNASGRSATTPEIDFETLKFVQ